MCQFILNAHVYAKQKINLKTYYYKRIIREDRQNCLFGKREISYNKPSACEKRWETFM